MRRALVFASALYNVSPQPQPQPEGSCVFIVHPRDSRYNVLLRVGEDGEIECAGCDPAKVARKLLPALGIIIREPAAYVPDWVAIAKRMVLRRATDFHLSTKKFRLPAVTANEILEFRNFEELLPEDLPKVLSSEEIMKNTAGRAIYRLLTARTKEEALNAVDAMKEVVSIPEDPVSVELVSIPEDPVSVERPVSRTLVNIESLEGLRNLVEGFEYDDADNNPASWMLENCFTIWGKKMKMLKIVLPESLRDWRCSSNTHPAVTGPLWDID